MNLTLVSIAKRISLRSDPATVLVDGYVVRAARYFPVEVRTLSSEATLLASVMKHQTHTSTHLILLDSRGKLLSSDDFAAYLGRLRDTGTRRATLAIGPADGWSDAARAQADLLLSLGPMTLPHELARVVLAEQIYRALTILGGHPYHTGH